MLAEYGHVFASKNCDFEKSYNTQPKASIVDLLHAICLHVNDAPT